MKNASLLATSVIIAFSGVLWSQQQPAAFNPRPAPAATTGLPISLPLTAEEQSIRDELRNLQHQLSDASDGAAIQKIKDRGRVLLEKQFDLLSELDSRQFDEMEKTLNRLRAAARKRVAAKSNLVDAQLLMFIQEAQGVSFVPPAAALIKSMPTPSKSRAPSPAR